MIIRQKSYPLLDRIFCCVGCVDKTEIVEKSILAPLQGSWLGEAKTEGLFRFAQSYAVGADIIRPPIHILARPIIVPPQELVQTHYNYRRAFHYF